MMSVTRISITLIGFLLRLALTNSIPILFEDSNNKYFDEELPISGLCGCFCGLHKKGELDSLNVDSKPVVSFTADYTQYNFDGLISCQDKCTSSTELLIKKLCREVGWITKPGYVFYKFCDIGKWISTGVMITEGQLVCCQNQSTNCSQTKIQDKKTYTDHQLHSKATVVHSDGTNVSDVLLFDIGNSTNNEVVLNFEEFNPMELGSGSFTETDENNEAYTEEYFFRSDYFDYSSSERTSDKEARVPRVIKSIDFKEPSLENKTDINNLNLKTYKNSVYPESTHQEQSATEMTTVKNKIPCSCNTVN